MQNLTDLLHNVESALAELTDSKQQLEALEELLEGFQRVERVNRREVDDLKRDLVRETSAAVKLRIRLTEAELLIRKTAKAWRRARIIACMAPSDEEAKLDEILERMGWFDDSPKYEKEG